MVNSHCARYRTVLDGAGHFGDERTIIEATDAEPEVVEALVENYEESHLDALRTALFASAIIVIIALFLGRKLPTKRVDEIAAETREAEAALAADADVP